MATPSTRKRNVESRTIRPPIAPTLLSGSVDSPGPTLRWTYGFTPTMGGQAATGDGVGEGTGVVGVTVLLLPPHARRERNDKNTQSFRIGRDIAPCRGAARPMFTG